MTLPFASMPALSSPPIPQRRVPKDRFLCPYCGTVRMLDGRELHERLGFCIADRLRTEMARAGLVRINANKARILDLAGYVPVFLPTLHSVGWQCWAEGWVVWMLRQTEKLPSHQRAFMLNWFLNRPNEVSKFIAATYIANGAGQLLTWSLTYERIRGDWSRLPYKERDRWYSEYQRSPARPWWLQVPGGE